MQTYPEVIRLAQRGVCDVENHTVSGLAEQPINARTLPKDAIRQTQPG